MFRRNGTRPTFLARIIAHRRWRQRAEASPETWPSDQLLTEYWVLTELLTITLRLYQAGQPPTAYVGQRRLQLDDANVRNWISPAAVKKTYNSTVNGLRTDSSSVNTIALAFFAPHVQLTCGVNPAEVLADTRADPDGLVRGDVLRRGTLPHQEMGMSVPHRIRGIGRRLYPSQEKLICHWKWHVLINSEWYILSVPSPILQQMQAICCLEFWNMTKSRGTICISAPLIILGDSSPCPLCFMPMQLTRKSAG